MIHTGRIQELRILRRSHDLLILGDEDEVELKLHASADPTGRAETLRVFVYTDRDGRQVATTRMPKAEVGAFATMRVHALRPTGALMDWGLEPWLLVPREEQERPLEEGRSYVVRVYLDESTGEIRGSTRAKSFLDNERLTVSAEDEVELLVFGRSELGYAVIVNGIHHGMLHTSDVFKPVSVGDRLVGYVKLVRDDHKLDIVLQPIGYQRYIDAHTALVAKRIQAKGGYLALTDKSSAEAIHDEFGISKRQFKQAVGALYKERLIRIEDTGIRWIG